MALGLSTRRAATAVVAATALLGVVPAAPSVAETVRVSDPAEDVVRLNDWSYFNAPYNQRADIVRFVTDHDGGQLRLVVQLRRIRKQLSISAVVKTPDARFHAWVSWKPGEPLSLELRRWDGPRICRHGVDGRVDTEADRVTYLVPRRCLGRPDWVRTGAVSFSFADPDKHITYFADDAGAAGGYVDGEFATLGERVHHGPT